MLHFLAMHEKRRSCKVDFLINLAPAFPLWLCFSYKHKIIHLQNNIQNDGAQHRSYKDNAALY